jgi:hypothetical protein
MELKKFVPRILVFAVVFLGVVTTRAMAVDLTGTWEGKLKCKGQSALHSTLVISQSGTDLNVIGTVTDIVHEFDGVAITQAESPTQGVAVMMGCLSGVEPFSLLMINTKTGVNPQTGDGKIKGTWLSAGSSGTSTCQVTYKRVDVIDQSVGGCF